MVCDTAANKANKGKIKHVITEVVAKFKELNPEAMQVRNGEKVLKPSWHLKQEAENREKWDKMTEEER